MDTKHKDLNKKPHREICAMCHEVSRIGFHVSNDIWELSTSEFYRNSILCLQCFTRLADERGVEWDKDIKFYPQSWISHVKAMTAYCAECKHCAGCKRKEKNAGGCSEKIKKIYCEKCAWYWLEQSVSYNLNSMAITREIVACKHPDNHYINDNIVAFNWWPFEKNKNNDCSLYLDISDNRNWTRKVFERGEG